MREELEMSVEANKAVILKGWECASTGDQEGLAVMYHDDVVYHGAAGQSVRGREPLMAMLNGYFKALPDMKAEVADVFGEGDRVFTRVRLTGTNTGELMGQPPTGKRVDIRWVMNVVRVQEGKVVEEWELFDNLDMMKQLGLIS